MNIKNTMKYYRDNILESLQDIDHDRYYNIKIKKESVSRLLNLTEAYYITAKDLNDSEAINEALSLSKRTEAIVKEYKFRNHIVKEGFENPFDEVGDRSIDTRYEEMVEIDPDKDMKISKVRLWNNNTDNKIVYRN
jgi:hypothetical protein